MSLPPKFVAYWRSCVLDPQSGKKPAQKEMRALCAKLERWERHGGGADSPHAIPGYLTAPRRSSVTRLPFGWSYSNLNKLRTAAGTLASPNQGGPTV